MNKLKEYLVNSIKCFNLLFKTSSKFTVAIFIAISLVVSVLPSISLIISKYLINQVQIKYITIEFFLIVCLIYISLDLTLVLLNKIITVLSFHMENNLILHLNEELIRKISKMELDEFETSEVYDLIKFNKEQSIGKIYFMATSFLTFIQIFISLSLTTLIVINTTPQMKIILSVFFILVTIKSFYSLNLGKERYKIIEKRMPVERKQWYLQFLYTNDKTFKEIKFFHKFDDLLKQFADNFTYIKKQNFYIMFKQMKIESIYSFFDIIITGTFFLNVLDLAWNNVILIGDATTSISGIKTIKNSIVSFYSLVILVGETSLYVDSLFKLLKDDDTDEIQKEKSQLTTDIKNIRFENINFTHKTQSVKVLKDVNLEFSAGNRYLIVGENGSGKSTFFKILLGLYDNYTGDISIGDAMLKNLDKASYQEKIGVLFQDFVKYELTLRENIDIRSKDNSLVDKNILNILNMLNFKFSKIEDMDKQLGAWFQGELLSEGEWLKIALCRAIYDKKVDMVVLDEPNSFIDKRTTESIFDYLTKFCNNKILIVILQHYHSIVQDNDNIIFFSKGGEQTIKTGKHNELLKNCKEYQLFVKEKENINES